MILLSIVHDFIIFVEIESQIRDIHVHLLGYKGDFRAAAIDLVLTDIDMPDINGFEMIRRLKQTSTHVQFIAMSGGYSIESVKKVADLLGARHTFKKPLHMPNLLTAIHQVTHPKQPQ